MSANRSVQAAQRRRAGPANGDAPIPGRGPQPSINSAQMFANQSKSGQGPNIPNGRLAGQQAASQQKQMQQQSFQQSQQSQQTGQQNDKLSSVSKMTISQAITLITLRLGSLESKLMNMPEDGSLINVDGESNLDAGLLQSIVSRLESLEKRSSSTNGTASTPELNLLKQQFETIKQVVVQTKSSTTSLIKENATLKIQIDNLRTELTETTELLTALQNLTMDNNQKIMDLTFGSTIEYGDELNNADITNYDEQNNLINDEFTHLENSIENNDSETNEIIGTNLKQLIENELNIESM